MKVNVAGTDWWLGNDGITLRIEDNSGNWIGRLRIGKATVEWAPKHAQMGAGGKAKTVKLEKFLSDYLDKLP